MSASISCWRKELFALLSFFSDHYSDETVFRPGMNRCGVSEEETTNALRALYQLPVSENHNVQQTYPVCTTSPITLVGAQHNLDQNPQDLSFCDEKKKLGTKKLSYPVHPSASKKQVNSIMKNEQAIVKSKNLQNGSQFPLESKLEKGSGIPYSNKLYLSWSNILNGREFLIAWLPACC